MKIKNNQDGVAHLAAILAVVVIVAIGVVGWKVWDNRETEKNNNSATSIPATTNDDVVDSSAKDVKTINPTASWTSFSKNSLEFKYPSDWKLDEQTVLRLTSSDFESTGVQKETVSSGALLTVSQTDIPQKNITADNYQKSSSALGGSNFKTLTISGNKVVQYTNNELTTTVFFRSNGTRIQVDITYAAKDSEASLNTYDLLLATVKAS